MLAIVLIDQMEIINRDRTPTHNNLIKTVQMYIYLTVTNQPTNQYISNRVVDSISTNLNISTSNNTPI